MGKKEQKGASAVEMDNSHGRDTTSPEEDVAIDASSDECEHFIFDTEEMYNFLETIKSFQHDPQCVDCLRETTAGELMMFDEPNPCFVLCSDCSRCFCAGPVTNEEGPRGHIRTHASSEDNLLVAPWIDQPDAAYCFECGNSLCLKLIVSASRAHAPRPDTDELGNVVRGIPNCGTTCYVNALVQCLLALDKLRMWMLGPDAPTGSLGVAPKELFLETNAGNGAGATLNPDKFLKSVSALNPLYNGRTQEDSQELLLYLLDGLSEEEEQKRPPKKRERPTVVHSIFSGSGFYELYPQMLLE